MIFLYVFLGLLILLIAIIMIKTLLFKDKTNYNVDKPIDVNYDDVVYKLGEMLKVKTISYPNKGDIDFTKYQEYIELTKKLYPTVFEICEFTQTKEYAIKLKLKGQSSEKPTILMAHYDVVPVTDGWQYDPFLGEVVDGYYMVEVLSTQNVLWLVL